MSKARKAKARAKSLTPARLKAIRAKTIPWDSAQYLETKEDIADYLEAVLEMGDPVLLSHSLGIIARSKGMAQIAKAPGSVAKACTRRCRKTAIRNSRPC